MQRVTESFCFSLENNSTLFLDDFHHSFLFVKLHFYNSLN